MMKLLQQLLAATLVGSHVAAQGTPPIAYSGDLIDYTDPYDNDFPLRGFVSAPPRLPAPGVVIIPDWSGVDDYEKIRATMITQDFGWVGFVADIYGPEYHGVEDMETKRELASMYRNNHDLFYGRIQAAVELVKNHPNVATDKVAVIGYCFGGTGVIAYSFMGSGDVTGAVSFHGGLTEFPVSTPMQSPILVLSGGADDTGTEVEFLEEQLNQVNATWQITRYSNIEHAWTKWDDPRYNEVADKRSWDEMGTFLAESFGMLEYGTTPPAQTKVEEVQYENNGFALTGYLAIPDGAMMGKTPAVVIVPDWDGVSGPNGYEALRATMLAEEGYIVFVADIFGSDYNQVDELATRLELVVLYRTDYELFVSRIQEAVDILKNHELVDPTKIVMIGYCFGGTGAVDYAFADVQDVQVVVPFHGGLKSLAPIQTDQVYPYVLIQSGGDDDAHGNNTQLEMALNSGGATWEITRYSDVVHGFTAWPAVGAYNPRADWRSWDAMLSVFDMVLDDTEVPPVVSVERTGDFP